MTREAETLWKKLDSVSEAIDAYQALIAEFGPSRDALSALEALFASARRWEELSDTFERHLDLCDTDDERLEILAKLGDIKREHLADDSGAIEVYRRALSIRTTHDASRAALAKLLESTEKVTRREAALILKPIFEAEGDNERLLTTQLIEVDTTDDPMEKLNGLGGRHARRRGTARRLRPRLRVWPSAPCARPWGIRTWCRGSPTSSVWPAPPRAKPST